MMDGPKKIPIIFETEPSENDWRSIEMFKKKADLLFQCELLKSGNNAISAHIEAEKGKPILFQVALPNEDALKSLILSFRPFYANNEPSNFKKVMNILKRYCRDKEVHETIETYVHDWDHSLLDGAMKITDKKGPITASRLFDLWFNGHYFHSDEDKDLELNSIKSVITEGYAKYLMVDSVYNCVKLIRPIYKGIKPLEKKQQQ